MNLAKEKVTLKMRVMKCAMCNKHLVKDRYTLQEYDKNGWVVKTYFCSKTCTRKYFKDILEGGG